MIDIRSNLVFRHIRIKAKIRKIVSYKSDDCELRMYHRKIYDFLSEAFINSIFAKAYSKHQSIFNNAKAHMYNDDFLMTDISSFFPSINHRTLTNRLFCELNKIDKNVIKYSECANIVRDCSIGTKGLPLGFVTSPILSNIYLKEFDGILYGKLKEMNLKNVIYTRYADDICISFKHESNCKQIYKSILIHINTILKRYHLE